MKIYLDDVREPYDDTWTVVRSYNDFVELVTTTPHIITHISFDHDLGIENDVVAKSGMDVAKFFIDYTMEHSEIGESLESIYAHSSNPPGRDNIKGIFNSAKKHGIFNMDLIVR